MERIDTYNEVQVGDEIVFFEGKNEKPVAYCEFGKVILCRHKIPLGYARVTSVEDKGRYFLVTAEHIVKDLYAGILYDDFIKALPVQGYEIGFDRIFKNESGGEIYDEHQILAYNKEIGTVIVAETFSAWGDRRMNSIYVSCPNMDIGSVMKNRYFHSGGGYMATLNLAHNTGNDYDLLKMVEHLVGCDGARWPDNAHLYLWTYADKETSLNGERLSLWESTICRIYAAPELMNMLRNCDFMIKVAALKKKGALTLVMDENGELLQENTKEC